jgi:hypothetical protein
MRKFLILLFLLTFVLSANAATIYKWVDERGVVHLTDDYNQVPASYRDRVREETIKDSPQVKIPSSPVMAPQKDEGSAFGLGEAYWRDRVRPWKEKLAEASVNYERVSKQYMERSDQLSQRRFGSRTQYKMDIIELDKLNEEKKRYEAQIKEANDMLNKISKEAEEARADPEWLK